MHVRGFTLIEMMVTIGIFTIISGIVLFNYNGFNSRILLQNLAYDVALTIRQAQVYGVGVRELTVNQTPPYGIFFAEDDTGGSTGSYILFADIDEDGEFDGNAGDCTGNECIERYVFQRGNRISQFCAVQGGTPICSLPGASSLQSLVIFFKRPNPEALFTAKDQGGSAVVGIEEAVVTVVNPEGTISKTITVKSTGQISVN
jgi:prepilin-type N-terminal cleavage/methylation domain-containing protein